MALHLAARGRSPTLRAAVGACHAAGGQLHSVSGTGSPQDVAPPLPPPLAARAAGGRRLDTPAASGPPASAAWSACFNRIADRQRSPSSVRWRSFAAAPLAAPAPAPPDASNTSEQQQQQQDVAQGPSRAGAKRSDWAEPEFGKAAAAALSAAAQGDVEPLVAQLRQRPSVSLLNAALKSLPNAQLLPLIHRCFPAQHAQGNSSGGSSGDIPGLQPNLWTAKALLERLTHAPELRLELDAALQRLLGAGLRPDYRLFLPWAMHHAQAGSVQGVRQVMALVEAHGCHLTAHYYAQLVRAYCTRGRWREAEPLLAEMRGRGVPPTEHVYRALIWCCGRHHRADRAQAAFDELVASGLEPSLTTWSALLNAYADSKQPRRAVEALRDMCQRGLKPSVEVYGALAKAFARSGDWRRALEVVDLMRHDGLAPNAQVWGSVIEAAAVAGKPSVAAGALARMRATGVAPNVIAYTSLLSAYGGTGDVAAAQGVVEDMVAAGCAPNSKTLTELMSQLAAAGRWQECEATFQRMLASGCAPDRVSYAILIDSMMHRWATDRQGQQALLATAAARWEAACAGPLSPHTFWHQPQGRLTLDLHGYSGWTAQLAVLSTLGRLLRQHRQQGARIHAHLSRLDIITGRGNRSARKNSPVLREVVLEMLQHLLPATLARSNDGLLVLEARKLRTLFDALPEGDGDPFSPVAMQHCLVDPNSIA